jgi:hypothetical protein
VSAATIPASLQRRVRVRAADSCEYCRLPQAGQEATFHVDHVTPLRANGPTVVENLALACVSCSLRKGARSHAPVPETREDVPLFNPRRDNWSEHFYVRDDGWIGASTATGRATAAALSFNRPTAVAIRVQLMKLGRYP